ncbi:MAG: NmrA family NAD(P)-binding protein [Armatimonadota bacterium]
MHIILGGTGHIGSALARALLDQGEPVTVVTRDAENAMARDLANRGANVAAADVLDTTALRRILHQGKRLFLLNPPAAPRANTTVEERRTLTSILAAIDGSGLERIVAESTYGAQPGQNIGDLGVLFEMEQALKVQPIPATIIRAAYYMSNWQPSIQTARESGVVFSLYPPDFALPMVAPEDIGALAARLMMQPADQASQTGPHYIEGPRHYTANDVAAALSAILGKPVRTEHITPDRWQANFKELGFSEEAAESFANMTRITLQGQFPPEGVVERGPTSLQDYLSQVK